MRVDIAGTTVDLDQMELEEGDIVMDVLIVARIQRADEDGDAITIAESDGVGSVMSRGLHEAAGDMAPRFRPAER